jgi:hypothetical protein
MTRDQIHTLLKNTRLSTHEREQLLQLLHYMDAEGISTTSSNNNNKKHAKNTKKKTNPSASTSSK